MKKILIPFFVLVFTLTIRANPLPSPSVALSELLFDNNGKWVIELQYFNANSNSSIDTIWIKSLSGISQIKKFHLDGTTGVFIIRNDSLLTDLSINPLKDSLVVIYKMRGYKQISMPIVYGDILNSRLACPQKGQSIAGVLPYYNYDGLYSIDKSPTLNAINDTIGMCGILNGRIFDKNNKLVTGISSNEFEFEIQKQQIYLPLTLKTDGSYSLNMYSINAEVKVLYCSDGKYYDRLSILPIKISMQPDSNVNMDIHILDSLRVGINSINKSSESIIKISPNPVSGLNLNYEISIPVKSSNCFLSLVNMNGQQIALFNIRENQGKILLPSNIQNGIYSLIFFVNNRNYSSVKIIISR